MTIRVATFNIRVASAPDGRNTWWLRRRAVVAAIRSLDADLVGIQEVLAPQLSWLQRHLGADHDVVSWGRHGRDRGERTVVVARRSTVSVDASSARWYSAEPDRAGSTGWGSRYPRFALFTTVARRGDDRPFMFVSTHFDHASADARSHAGSLLASWVTEAADPARAVVVGDMNCPTDAPPLRPLLDVPLTDALAHLPGSGAGARTVHSFRGGDDGPRIDQILVGSGWHVTDATVVRARHTSWSGTRWPSDHYPVLATLVPG